MKTALIALVVLAALGFALHRAAEPPDRPQPIAWDQEACAHCKMLIGEPGFAAQIIDDSGRVLDFDDPGCLLAYVASHEVAVHAAWFHHARDDRWLAAGAVGFVEVARSPMGFRIGAVDAGSPGAIGLEDAKARVVKP